MEYLKDLGLGLFKCMGNIYLYLSSLQVYPTGRLGDAKPSRSP